MLELSEIIKKKKTTNAKILKEHSADKATRAVIFNAIENSEISEFIENACKEIGVLCLKNIPDEKIFGIDAFVSDSTKKSETIEKFLKNFVTPILPSTSTYELSEFNPMKFAGNAFLFEENKKFLIFEKICRMLENMNYPGDRRVLVRNISEKFAK